jgi:hypothetical protein
MTAALHRCPPPPSPAVLQAHLVPLLLPPLIQKEVLQEGFVAVGGREYLSRQLQAPATAAASSDDVRTGSGASRAGAWHKQGQGHPMAPAGWGRGHTWSGGASSWSDCSLDLALILARASSRPAHLLRSFRPALLGRCALLACHAAELAVSCACKRARHDACIEN